MAARSEQLQIRVTPAEKRALKERARQSGLDVSAYVLTRALPHETTRLTGILRTLRRDDADRRFALAELNDLLTTLTGARFADVADTLRVDALSPLLQNYVAAMVEQAAAQKGTSPPAWVRDVVPLDAPYFAVSFPSLRPYLLRVAPVAFKRRNLFLDATLGDRV